VCGKSIARVFLLILTAILLNACAAEPNAEKGTAASKDEVLTGLHYIEMDIAGYGVITAELNADEAPITVSHFMRLVENGFYDGLAFHRIISGFMIQGGDPNGDGTGGAEQNIKGEFSANGVENGILHERGTLSMARTAEYDSASSQFFIVHQTSPQLDGQYAAFGKVLSGIEVVDLICETVPVTDENGTVAFTDKPVINSIRRIDLPAK